MELVNGFEKSQNCVLLTSSVSHASLSVSCTAAMTAAMPKGSNPIGFM